MAYRDLRAFLSRLDERGLLRRISAEVDWDLELGTIVDQVEEAGGPALLFENVKDSRVPMLCAALSNPERLALAMELPADLRGMQYGMMERLAKPIPSVQVESGPCQENVVLGPDIDLASLPTPRWHPLDGGRYVGTLGVVITRDPETGRQNAAIYRQQIVGRDKTGVLLGRDGSIALQKYQAMGQPMPIATCFGLDPAILIAAPLAVSYGEDEMALAGALRQEPVPVVRGKTVDLLVPATAEFVFEGTIAPNRDDWLEEGPFGEYTGYYAGERGKQPTIQLTAITHRNDPIMQGVSAGKGTNEHGWLTVVGRAIALKADLIRMGVPGIKDVWARGRNMIAVISLERQYYAGHARQVIDAALATTRFKYFIVVDGDVDVFDQEQVDWALAMHVQPHRDIVVTDDRRRGSNLDPSINPAVRPIPINQTSKMGIDATTQYKGFPWSTRIQPDPDVLRRVLDHWDEYGLGPLPARV